MQGKIIHNPQADLFKIPLKDIVSEKIDLVQLTYRINWSETEKYFGPYHSEQGRPNGTGTDFMIHYYNPII